MAIKTAHLLERARGITLFPPRRGPAVNLSRRKLPDNTAWPNHHGNFSIPALFIGILNAPLGWMLEIAKNAQNRNYFPVYAEKFERQFIPLFRLFCLFILQEDEEYLVAWRVSQVPDTLEKLGNRPCLVWCQRQFSEIWWDIYGFHCSHIDVARQEGACRIRT